MHTNGVNSELFDNLRLELRRGCLVVAVLVQLRTELYGYALRKALSDQGLAIDENTLYPLLRRLERDRRSELARFEATKPQQIRGGIFHYASFGLYTRRDNGDESRPSQIGRQLHCTKLLAISGRRPPLGRDASHKRQ